jgi:hypothetical protein
MGDVLPLSQHPSGDRQRPTVTIPLNPTLVNTTFGRSGKLIACTHSRALKYSSTDVVGA